MIGRVLAGLVMIGLLGTIAVFVLKPGQAQRLEGGALATAASPTADDPEPLSAVPSDAERPTLPPLGVPGTSYLTR